MLGTSFHFSYLPTVNTRGGILVAWRHDIWRCTVPHCANHSVSLKLTLLADGFQMWVTTVYGPHTPADKETFLQELRLIRATRPGPWLPSGDFNLIYKAEDKNNGLLNRRLMGKFQRFLQDMELDEIHLNRRLYTWSNERQSPTLERIDRAFISLQWADRFPNHRKRALSTNASNYSPLLLHTNAQPSPHKRFRFESIWSRFVGYIQAIEEGWVCPLQNADVF